MGSTIDKFDVNINFERTLLSSDYSQLYYVTAHSSNESITVEPQYNKPLYNEVLHIVNNFLHPSNSKIYENEPIF